MVVLAVQCQFTQLRLLYLCMTLCLVLYRLGCVALLCARCVALHLSSNQTPALQQQFETAQLGQIVENCPELYFSVCMT